MGREKESETEIPNEDVDAQEITEEANEKNSASRRSMARKRRRSPKEPKTKKDNETKLLETVDIVIMVFGVVRIENEKRGWEFTNLFRLFQVSQ